MFRWIDLAEQMREDVDKKKAQGASRLGGDRGRPRDEVPTNEALRKRSAYPRKMQQMAAEQEEQEDEQQLEEQQAEQHEHGDGDDNSELQVREAVAAGAPAAAESTTMAAAWAWATEAAATAAQPSSSTTDDGKQAMVQGFVRKDHASVPALALAPAPAPAPAPASVAALPPSPEMDATASRPTSGYDHLVEAGSESDEEELPLNSSRSRPCTSLSPPAQIAASSVAPRANVSPVRAHDSGSDSDDVEDDSDIPLRTTSTHPLEMEEKKRKRAAAAAPAVPPWRSGGAAAVAEMLHQAIPSVRGKKARVSPSLQHAGGLSIGDAASALKLTAPTKVVEEVDCPELGCPELGMGWRCILKKRDGAKHVDKYYIGPDGTQYNSRVKASQRASEDVATWVQCDKCDKWRSMPAGWKCRAVSSSRTLSFECAQHPINELASCEVPEEKFQGAWSYGADELDKRAASARKQAEAEGLLLKPSPGAAAGASSTSSRFLHVQLVCSTSGGALI